MKSFRQSAYFFCLCILFLIAGLISIAITDKGTFYLWLNRMNSPSMDFFFKAITYLGDGLVFLVLTFLLLLKRIQLFFLFLLTYLTTGIFVQLLKNLVFKGAIRPAKYFESLPDLHIVTGVDVHHYHSFPSGHTATAFALFLLLSILINNKWLGVLFFILALLVGISRIYLSQHFLGDVLAGATIGIVLTYLCHRFVSNNSWFHNKAWMQRSLLQAFKRNDKA